MLEILKSLHFSQFVAIFADFNEICSEFLENAEKPCNFSKFLDFNLIFIMIIPEIYLIFDGIFDLILNLILTEPPPTLGSVTANNLMKTER